MGHARPVPSKTGTLTVRLGARRFWSAYRKRIEEARSPPVNSCLPNPTVGVRFH